MSCASLAKVGVAKGRAGSLVIRACWQRGGKPIFTSRISAYILCGLLTLALCCFACSDLSFVVPWVWNSVFTRNRKDDFGKGGDGYFAEPRRLGILWRS